MLVLKNTGIRTRARGIQPEAVLAIQIVYSVWEKYFGHEYDCVISSICDGKHMKGSRHYIGFAPDVSTKDIPKNTTPALFADISEALGPDFDVIKEKTHIHVEFDPKH